MIKYLIRLTLNWRVDGSNLSPALISSGKAFIALTTLLPDVSRYLAGLGVMIIARPSRRTA